MPDTAELGKVLRVIYKDQPGVFLTNEQELITLAKFQWKEIYKLQALDFKYENYKLRVDIAKSMLETKTKENAVNESLKLQFKKESRIYKICTYTLMGVVTYLVVVK